MKKSDLLKELEKLSLFCLQIENQLTGVADFREDSVYKRIKRHLGRIRMEIDSVGIIAKMEAGEGESRIENRESRGGNKCTEN